MYGVAAYGQSFGRAGGMPCRDAPYPVRGFSVQSDRRQCCGLCLVTAATHACADPLDSGPFVAQRGRTSCDGRDRYGRWIEATHHHGRSVPRRRCALGDGRRVALSQLSRCHRRDMGRSAHARFYRHQAIGLARGSGGCLLLAHSSRGQPRSECGARPLADRQPAICGASPRSTGPRCAALVARSVPLAPRKTGAMGGDL